MRIDGGGLCVWCLHAHVAGAAGLPTATARSLYDWYDWNDQAETQRYCRSRRRGREQLSLDEHRARCTLVAHAHVCHVQAELRFVFSTFHPPPPRKTCCRSGGRVQLVLAMGYAAQSPAVPCVHVRAAHRCCFLCNTPATTTTANNYHFRCSSCLICDRNTTQHPPNTTQRSGCVWSHVACARPVT